MNQKLIFLTLLVIFGVCLSDKNFKTCRCLAHLDVTDGLSDANRLRTLDVSEQLPKVGCDNRGEFMCKAFCKEIFKVETNGFDLDKTPNINTTTPIKISLGQYLCDILHRDISNVLLGMTSEFTCLESKDSTSTTSSLKIFCDKKLTCTNTKYVNKSMFIE